MFHYYERLNSLIFRCYALLTSLPSRPFQHSSETRESVKEQLVCCQVLLLWVPQLGQCDWSGNNFFYQINCFVCWALEKFLTPYRQIYFPDLLFVTYIALLIISLIVVRSLYVGKLTVGKLYGGVLIYEIWKTTRWVFHSQAIWSKIAKQLFLSPHKVIPP